MILASFGKRRVGNDIYYSEQTWSYYVIDHWSNVDVTENKSQFNLLSINVLISESII